MEFSATTSFSKMQKFTPSIMIKDFFKKVLTDDSITDIIFEVKPHNEVKILSKEEDRYRNWRDLSNRRRRSCTLLLQQVENSTK